MASVSCSWASEAFRSARRLGAATVRIEESIVASRDLAVSPHHLSRVFSAANGSTISRHRMRLRARIAMERLAAGDHDLARLAADLGFADQSHLCRVVRAETRTTPSALRAALA